MRRQLQRELNPNLFEEAGDLLARVACSESFDRQVTAIAYFVDDGFHSPQIRGDLFRAVAHLFLDLPGDGVGSQRLDLGVRVDVAEAADV